VRAAKFDREIDELCRSARSLERDTIRMCRALPGWREGRIEDMRKRREAGTGLNRSSEKGAGGMRIRTVAIDPDVEQVMRAARLDGDNLAMQG